MEDITTIAALSLLRKSYKSSSKRRRVWVHNIIRRRTEFGEFHRLIQVLTRLSSSKPALFCFCPGRYTTLVPKNRIASGVNAPLQPPTSDCSPESQNKKGIFV